MGPRVFVEPAEFLRIVEKNKGLIIQGRKVAFQGITYVSRCGDYYYYTTSKEPLNLPRDCDIQKARAILL